MSFTTTIFPILAALITPEGEFFKTPNRWKPINHQQEYFVAKLYDKKAELSLFSPEELRNWVSFDYQFLNKTARDNGFSIEFQPFGDREFGVLSILDVSVTWLEKGTEATIYYQDEAYKGVCLKKGFEAFTTGQHPHPILKVTTKSCDVLYLTKATEALHDFELLEKVNQLNNTLSDGFHRTASCQRVPVDIITFPKVSVNQTVDISWLTKMSCPDIKLPYPTFWWEITQAYQQTKFAMHEEGARVESAVMISFALCGCATFEPEPVIITIDEPFYVWIMRPGCSIPVFTGYIDVSDWARQRENYLFHEFN